MATSVDPGRSKIRGLPGSDVDLMPMDIVTDLVGLADAGWQNTYAWGVEGFNAIGPPHADRTASGPRGMRSCIEYARRNIPAKTKPGSRADQVFADGRAAGWSEKLCRGVLNDYVPPSLDTTIQYFSRMVTRDVGIGGVTLPAGSWVLVMFASANRDPREFPDPGTFDVERDPAQPVGRGMGKHGGDHAYVINNIIRGLSHLELTLTPAAGAVGKDNG